jgi:predicted phosphohydrolase
MTKNREGKKRIIVKNYFYWIKNIHKLMLVMKKVSNYMNNLQT